MFREKDNGWIEGHGGVSPEQDPGWIDDGTAILRREGWGGI